MKLKAAVPWALVLATLLILGSCDAMFQANLFKAAGLGQVKLDDISTVADIEDAAGSPSFYEELEQDPAAKAEIILILETEGSTDSLALAARIELETSPAMEVADAFVGQIQTVMDELAAGGQVDLGLILSAVLPADISLGSPTPPAAFVDIVDGFLAAAAQFTDLAAGLGVGETIEDTPYMAAGDVAYYALVSLAIGAVVPTVGGDTIAEGLWKAINGDDSAINLADTAIDPADPASGAVYDIFTAAGLAAQGNPANLVPKDARTMGMGGTFSALSSGYQSLFGNPAGFGAPKASLTIMDAGAWLYVKPTTENLAKLQDVIADPSSAIGVASELVTDNGIGGGASLGLGYVGRGLGLGFYLVNEEYARGNTLMGTQLSSQTQANLVLGMAVPIGTKDFNLTIGGDVRPSFMLSGSWPASDVLDAFFGGGDPMTTLRAQNVLSGFNVFLDLGASLKLGSLGIGLAVRDIAPSVAFAPSTLGEVIDGLGGELPKAADGDPKTSFLPNITAGLSWSPRLIPGLIEPSVYFEIQDPVRAIQERAEFWNLLHFGGELKLLSFAYLRGGLNRGWLSAGFGLDLLILEVNAAVFTEELGRRPGDQGRSGIAVQAAFRL